jgi:hypothetical protein
VCDGEWQRRQTYEAERWCRATRTIAVNQALTPEGKVANPAGTVVEYECLPETVALKYYVNGRRCGSCEKEQAARRFLRCASRRPASSRSRSPVVR